MSCKRIGVLGAGLPAIRPAMTFAEGNELEGFAAGTAWAEIPDDWCCPDCGVREKVDFVPIDPRQAVGG